MSAEAANIPLPAGKTVLRPTREIVNEVVKRLSLLRLANGDKTFEVVKPFAETNIVVALQKLVVNQSRAAFVVFDTNEWHAERDGQSSKYRRVTRIVVLFTDRVLGDYDVALYGNEKTPGAIGLSELGLPAIVGLLLPNPAGVELVPMSEDPAIVEIDQKKLPGRAVVSASFEARGGWMSRPLGIGPVV